METIDSGGEWWLPENPERKVAGWLTFDPDQGAVLRLVGTLQDADAETHGRSGRSMVATDASLESAGSYPRILGMVGTKAVTLEGCFRTSMKRQIFGGGLPSETITADCGFRGVWYEPDEEASGDTVTAVLAHLVYWIRPAWLQEVWAHGASPRQTTEAPRVELRATDVATVSIERPEGILSLVQRIGSSGDGIAEHLITQDFDVRFATASIRPWETLVDEIGSFQDVLTLAVDRVPSIERITLNHPDVDQTLPNGNVHRGEIDVFARWTDRGTGTDPKELHEQDVLFHFDAVGTDGLQRLLATADRYRAELRRVTATARTTQMYPSDRLLNRCAAIESLDRTRTGTKQSNFKARIRRCVEFAGDPFLEIVPDVETWLEVLRTRRDHVAHHLANDGRETGFIDLVLADSAYFLFTLCFLRDAEVAAPVFERFKHIRRVRSLARRIPGAITRSD